MWSKERDLVFQAPGFSHSANSWSAAAPPKPQPRPGGLVGGLWVGEEGLGHHRPCPPGSHPSPTPHPGRTTIWDHRVRFLEEQALPHWATFTIWNAGRQGRRLYRSLTAGSQRKVGARPCTTPAPPRPSPARQAALPPLPEAVSCVLPRWLPSATWTRTRSERASTATRALRCGPPYTPARDSLTPHLAHHWVPSQAF